MSECGCGPQKLAAANSIQVSNKQHSATTGVVTGPIPVLRTMRYWVPMCRFRWSCDFDLWNRYRIRWYGQCAAVPGRESNSAICIGPRRHFTVARQKQTHLDLLGLLRGWSISI